MTTILYRVLECIVLDIKWIFILVEGCKVAAMKSTEKFCIDPFEMECACKQMKPLIMSQFKQGTFPLRGGLSVEIK